jgi:16S rRNA (cytidine1402-2'-O)-methyltransferase
MASGFWAERFIFGGFLPEKTGERVALAQKLDALGLTMVFFEAPHRLTAALGDLSQTLGARPALLAREMTKAHEEYLWATLPELLASARERPRKGEITLVIAPGEPPPAGEPDWGRLADLARDDPRPLGQVAGELAAGLGRPKKEVYGRLLRLLSSPETE